MKKTWDRAAMRFASARYVDRQGMLDATFENGDHFLIAVESVLPAASLRPRWAFWRQCDRRRCDLDAAGLAENADRRDGRRSRSAGRRRRY